MRLGPLIDLAFLLAVPIAFLAGTICRRWTRTIFAAVLIAIVPLVLIYIPLSQSILGALGLDYEFAAQTVLTCVLAGVAGHLVRLVAIWAAAGWQHAVGTVIATGVILAGGLYFSAELLSQVLPSPWSEMAWEAAKFVRPTCTLESTKELAVPELPRFEDPFSEILPPPQTQLNPKFSKLPVVKDAWKNFIGPDTAILASRAELGTGEIFQGIGITVVVDENGNVVDAAAISGPVRLRSKALAIAHTWKFEPFLIGGEAKVVRVEALGVRIDLTQIHQLRGSPFPSVSDLDDVSFQYQLRPGFGGANFDFTLRGNGIITYDGAWGVALTGRHCARIPQANVIRLIEEFRRLKFNSLADEYIGGSDGGTEYLTFRSGGKSKSITLASVSYGAGLPAAIWTLPRYLAYTAQAKRWTTGNRYTVASLKAEDWDFSRTDRHNLDIVAGIASFGDETTLSDVIRAGAKVTVEPPQTFSVYPGLASLEIAASRSNIPMVQSLLATQTRWPSIMLSNALSDVSGLGDINLVRNLIARGANPDHENHRSERTPLISAASSGMPDVVRFLISSGAQVNAKGQYGRTPLHWAVTWLHADDPVLPGANRAKVVELLLKAGANVNARDDDGDTPIMSEWFVGAEAAPVLIAHGADVNAHDDVYGYTALMVCRNSKVTQLLLEAGANPYAKDSFGATALDTARKSSWKEVASVLQAWMASHPQRR